MSRGGDFWSRRRAAVVEETKAEEAAVIAREEAVEEARLAERSDEEFLEELGLPEPEDMDETEQVQTLLRSTVPQRLKTRALRQLWRLNPILANVDGLVDYGEDYTDAAMVVENMQTVYQVGKGMFDKFAVEEEPEVPEAPEAEGDDEGDTALALDEAGDETPEPVDPPAAPYTFHDSDDPEPVALAPSRRRMRFHFDT